MAFAKTGSATAALATKNIAAPKQQSFSTQYKAAQIPSPVLKPAKPKPVYGPIYDPLGLMPRQVPVIPSLGKLRTPSPLAALQSTYAKAGKPQKVLSLTGGSGGGSGSGGTYEPPPTPQAIDNGYTEQPYAPPDYSQGMQGTLYDNQQAGYALPGEGQEGIDAFQDSTTTGQGGLLASQSFANATAVTPGTSATAALAANAATVKPGIIDRILAFLGLARKVTAVISPATVHGEPNSRSSVVVETVNRARRGDQNAMALICAVRKAAQGGNIQSRISYQMMEDYIAKNPVNSDVAGDDDDNADFGALGDAVRVSHGPLLTKARVKRFLSNFGAEGQNAFVHGMSGRSMRNPSSKVQEANALGKIVGHARKLQAIRMPNVPLAKFDSMLAWELGE